MAYILHLLYLALETLASGSDDNALRKQAKGALWIIHGNDKEVFMTSHKKAKKASVSRYKKKNEPFGDDDARERDDEEEADDAGEGLSGFPLRIGTYNFP